MKYKMFKLLLLLATSLGLLSACYSRRATPAATDSPTPNTAAPASSMADPPAGTQPAPQPAAPATAASTATKNGWWVRVNPSVTTAQAITLQIGTSKFQREEWRVWRPGEPVEFDVPEKYAQTPRLYLRGSVTPIGQFASLCMMYKTRGVEHLSFDDDDSETKSQTSFDPKCQ